MTGLPLFAVSRIAWQMITSRMTHLYREKVDVAHEVLKDQSPRGNRIDCDGTVLYQSTEACRVTGTAMNGYMLRES